MTEKEKMQAGLWFNANFDPALCAEREQTAELCQALNSTPYTSKESRKILLARLLPGLSEKAGLLSPFQCDYGFNITIGEGYHLPAGETKIKVTRMYFTDGNGIYPSIRPDYETAFVFTDYQFFQYKIPSWIIPLCLDLQGEGNEVLTYEHSRSERRN